MAGWLRQRRGWREKNLKTKELEDTCREIDMIGCRVFDMIACREIDTICAQKRGLDARPVGVGKRL